DGGPGCDQDEVTFLEAGRKRVEIREATPDPTDLAAVRVEVVEPVVSVVQEIVEPAETYCDAPIADLEELALCPVDRLLDLCWILVADPRDLARGTDQIAEDRLALDDPRVLNGVDGGGRHVRQRRHIR